MDRGRRQRGAYCTQRRRLRALFYCFNDRHFFSGTLLPVTLKQARLSKREQKQARGDTQTKFNLKWPMNPFASFPWPPSYSLT